MSLPASIYEFGPFRYDTGQRVLFRDGQIVALAPKALETLEVLLDRRGRVVEKAELMKLVWPDTVVEEVGLARNISLVRKALGDESETFIETIPKRGYRFVAEVVEGRSVPAAAPPARRRWLWRAAATLAVFAGLVYWQFYRPSRYLPPGVASIAVIPFERLTPDLDRATDSQGLNEVLVAEIAKLSGVHVISPSTVEHYRDLKIPPNLMTRLLGVQVILEGTVQKTADRLMVSVRLADVRSGKLIWAEHYEHPAAAVDQVQNELARTVAAQVGAHLAIHSRFPEPSH